MGVSGRRTVFSIHLMPKEPKIGHHQFRRYLRGGTPCRIGIWRPCWPCFPETTPQNLIRVAKACAIPTPSLPGGVGRADFTCMTKMGIRRSVARVVIIRVRGTVFPGSDEFPGIPRQRPGLRFVHPTGRGNPSSSRPTRGMRSLSPPVSRLFRPNGRKRDCFRSPTERNPSVSGIWRRTICSPP